VPAASVAERVPRRLRRVRQLRDAARSVAAAGGLHRRRAGAELGRVCVGDE
jgi:hypothetical protein